MLKYLFTAEFADGHIIQQTQDDRSAIEPDKRSQFFDVLEYEKVSPLVRFALHNDASWYAVDLTDGRFYVKGEPFKMHEEPLTEPLRIIFFRNHTHGFNQAFEEMSHEVVYRMGWQTNLDGKNYQRVMQIA